MSSDTIIKLIIGLLTALILGAYKWVWDTNEEVTINEIELSHVKDQAKKLEKEQVIIKGSMDSLREDISTTEKKVYGLDRDIDYIKQGIDDIRKDIKELKEQK